jgi:septal ring factor EnvC (AmiA/AmiB activator)
MTVAINRFRFLAAGSVVGVCIVSFGVGAQTGEERALEAVRGQIQSIERRLAQETSERDAQNADLRTAELAIAAVNGELARIRDRLREQQARQRTLAAQELAAGDRLAAEKAALSQQVRLSYMTGREEFVKLLLSQESPATLGRMLVYYDYFNRARSERIKAVGAELLTLAALANESRQIEAELGRLQSAQARELASLESARAQRRRAIADLDTSIAAGGGEIGKLRREEERLSALIIELGELLAGFPNNAEEPFAALKGRLPWPVQGRLGQRYGQLRGAGPLRWNGVMLAADLGAVVRAVYHGRVAFSDWLPGLGLLIILDHGDGYMSLYGHNDVLLRESGDWVEPGEPIAQVGDSGGQAEPALYFEIRHRGAPIDPGPWVSTGTPRR